MNNNQPDPRSIDALVAENIMGYKWYHSKYVGRSHCPIEVWSYQLLKNPPTGDWEGSVVDISEVPNKYRFNYAREYSTQIAAAMDVVKRMKEGGGISVDLNNDDHDGDYNTVWHCMFLSVERDIVGMADESTAPLAICLAALRAKGVEI